MLENIAIGIDIEEISRFENKTLEKDIAFLEKIFTKNELDYCYSKKNYSHSLAARFCAKEAVVKALSDFDIKDVFYKDIEILKHTNNVPYAIISKYPNIKIKISLSHSKTYAVAQALVHKPI